MMLPACCTCATLRVLLLASWKTSSATPSTQIFKLVFAVVKAVEIIGEAAANVSSSTREQYPQIPWYLIAGMRNRLVHGYFDVDLDQVWSTVTEDLPPLLAELETILPDVPPDYRSPFV